ncbi:uncharacterized protein CLAFUR5_05070 [Fulvia fulva]|uniref:ChrR-like cupin domain-containing protein n=1 Tax=Passalora fulva TaxID=5499 RepID=A0A9Q8LH97_PASFU|nr:uncharacterized protein CLAFUR5_05070 [Fulvia fulva]KAK4617239.1 hypothetical protein CLAFUR0_10459 [Fulvia fulva]UJO16613.1 hypothetical protein CLAFUR5_05070 [Fulvia fulva]
MTVGNLVDLSVVDTNLTAYELFPVPYINAQLEHNMLHNDGETGMMVLKMVCRAGFTNPWHSHFCGHGFFVLEGVLDIHKGQYGAGSWVWFPEGGLMYHGATKDQDVTFLFVTNKKFSIHFVDDTSDPCA